MIKQLLLTATVAAAGVVVAAPLASGQDLYDCRDFDTQPEAQAIFDSVPNDPYGLDADGDELACESLPGGPTAGANATGDDVAAADAAADAVVPVGGVGTGFGGLAGDGDAPWAPVVVGVGVAGAAAAAVATRKFARA